MSLRSACLIFCAISAAGCATTTPPTDKSGTVSAKTLKPGDCGLFGWSADQARDFVFFADKKTARFNGQNGPVDLKAQTPFPSLDYVDRSGNSVTLRLGQGEIMDGGMRYPRARIVTLTEEGWERLQPVAIVRNCQPK